MYILRCSTDEFYTGSTKYLDLRIQQHQNGEGSNFTKKRLPVELVYYEDFYRIDEAFYREKQVQGWSKKKKEALINSRFDKLSGLAECKNDSHFKNKKNDRIPAFDSSQATSTSSLSEVEMNDSKLKIKNRSNKNNIIT